MIQQTKKPQPKAVQTYVAPPKDEKKKQAEQTEVVGRHKNDGQKDHKGAR